MAVSNLETNFREIRAPDLLLVVEAEFVELNREMNAGQKGLVEGFETIGGHEKDPAVVFDVTKEDGNHCIVFDVLEITAL